VLIFREDYPEMRAALLAAYRRERPLPAEDEARIDTFIAGNLLATLCWAARPESASHRHEIEPWVARWTEAIAKYCKLSS
jgi:Ser/Thr protein kinase RdoA (MazF antagonist)